MSDGNTPRGAGGPSNTPRGAGGPSNTAREAGEPGSKADGAKPRPKVGVVLPLANEERTIEELLDRILLQLQPQDEIFCVMDTGGEAWTRRTKQARRREPDRTKEIVEQRGRQDPRVKLVWAPENRSVVDAYFRGYREALKAGCEWIVEMDGGFSHLPEEIPRFLDAMKNGADFAAGSRFKGPGRIERAKLSRYMLSRGGTMMANLMLGTHYHDMTSGFKCHSRRAMQQVVEHGVRSRAHFFQIEVRLMLKDWNWVEVPITYSSPSGRVPTKAVADATRNLLFYARRRLLP